MHVGAVQVVVLDVDGLVGAHGQRLAQRVLGVLGADGQHGDLRVVGLVGDLQRLLDRVLVELRQQAVDVSRSTVRSSAKCRSPVASGTYFTQTTILKLTPALLLLVLRSGPSLDRHPVRILLVSTHSAYPVLKAGNCACGEPCPTHHGAGCGTRAVGHVEAARRAGCSNHGRPAPRPSSLLTARRVPGRRGGCRRRRRPRPTPAGSISTWTTLAVPLATRRWRGRAAEGAGELHERARDPAAAPVSAPSAPVTHAGSPRAEPRAADPAVDLPHRRGDESRGGESETLGSHRTTHRSPRARRPKGLPTWQNSSTRR